MVAHKILTAITLALICFDYFGLITAAVFSEPVTYYCDNTGILHVVWQPRDPKAKVRVCLYVNSFHANRGESLVFIGQWKTDPKLSKDSHLLSLQVPADYLHCRQSYRWKIEDASLMQDALQSAVCSETTDSERCEIQIGRGSECIGGSASALGSISLDCAVLPSNLSFLQHRCKQELQLMTTKSTTEDNQQVALASANKSTVIVLTICLAGFGVMLALRRKIRAASAGANKFGTQLIDVSELKRHLQLHRERGVTKCTAMLIAVPKSPNCIIKCDCFESEKSSATGVDDDASGAFLPDKENLEGHHMADNNNS